jgi:hypothetical protein
MEQMMNKKKPMPIVVDRSKEARKIFVKLLREKENGKV